MIKVLPLILSWGVWLARNASIFQENPSSPERVAIQGLGILSHFPQEKGSSPIWPVQEITVDFSYPWAFPDGASQNNYQQCVGGPLLHLSQNHFFKLKMGLDQGTNNYAELLALKLFYLQGKKVSDP